MGARGAIRQATEALKTSQVSLAQRSLRSVKQLEEFLETPKAQQPLEPFLGCSVP